MRKMLVSVLLFILLMGCEPPRRPCPGPCPGPCPINESVRDGSIIFCKNGILVKPIYKHTGSNLTHVAIVLYVGSEPWVYEATIPRVRRLPLDVYFKELEKKQQKFVWKRRNFSWFTMQPCISFTADELKVMKQYADSQLGRRYMMRGWWKDREVRGIMCSQYVGNVIEQSGWIVSSNFRESPGALHVKLAPLYN